MTATQKYEVFLPLKYNDGSEIEKEKFDEVENELADRFGGLTAVETSNPLRGIWKDDGETYVDEIVILTTLDFGGNDDNSEFFTNLKERIKKSFDQLEVLITESITNVF